MLRERVCANILNYITCGSTLLNHLRKLPIPLLPVPKILGVDDFAFCRGQRYGTILVDLERHQPVALLPDRKAETLAEWLRQNPGVQVLSRDRARAYKSGMSQGAPEAIQVADRFHLVQNLGETLESVLSGYHAELKAAESQQQQASTAASNGIVFVRAKSTATAKAQQQTQIAHQQRVERHRQVWQLRAQEQTQEAIARAVGVSIRTVRRILEQSELSETPPRRNTLGRSLLDPYKPQLVEWWNVGIQQPQKLMALLQQKGYPGSQRTLSRYLSRLREAQVVSPTGQDLPRVVDPQSPPLTARRASFLILKREEKRDAEESELLGQLAAQHLNLAMAVDLAEEFLRLLRERQAEAFDAWLTKALKSGLKPFEKLAAGLLEDYAAVKASMMLSVSNGPVEGLINRLKMLKRQMYGRGGLELLSKRFIMTL